jgi:hypothetical protein
LIFSARIQERTETFSYGYFDKRDRPPPILIKHLNSDRIAGTASQKLCLFRLFPIIFHDLIDKLPSFIIYQQLRDIVSLVLAYPFRKTWLPVLNDLCLAFQTAMTEHFPSKMIPKVHFVAEYGRIIENYGPAVKYWCMRYEGYHSYFKRIALRSNNFKNTAKMLACRHQLKQAFLLSTSTRSDNSIEAKKIKLLNGSSFDNHTKQLLFNHFGNIDLTKNLFQCATLRHKNIEYHQSSVYVIDWSEIQDKPMFIQVIHIMRMSQKWWLLVDKLMTMHFHDLLCAWEVQTTNSYFILDPDELIYYHKALDVYELNNSSFVFLSSKITSWQQDSR